MSTLIPDYLSIDFSTAISRLKDQISQSDTFKDVNYEGSNISILIELFAYVADQNTYFLNKLAKNQFSDTADIYENVHRLSTLVGYKPKGYISSSGALNITVSGEDIDNKTWTIPKWTQFKTKDITDEDGNIIYFTTTSNAESISLSGSSSVVFTGIPIKQGEPLIFSEGNNNGFTGNDLINNRLSLPLYNYAHDSDLEDAEQSIILFVNDVEWIRINDFYEDVSGSTETNNVYTFEYTKYKEYIISFSPFRNVPNSTDKIEIWTLKSLGPQGNVISGSITDYLSNNFIVDADSSESIDMDSMSYTITNPLSINGGEEPEIITSIKENSKSVIHTQYRNVTKSDYKTHLELYDYIQNAIVWGEQEANPDGGNIFDFNKVYICCIPPGEISDWTGRINTYAYPYIDTTTNITSNIYIPIVDWLGADYATAIKTYLMPRKMLCSYEQFVQPELIYFKFNIGLRIKNNYKFQEVKRDTEAKLIYYFNSENRNFEDIINFTDIIYTLMNTSYIDDTTSNEFTKTAGLLNVVIRDINFFNTDSFDYQHPYTYNNDDGSYPQFSESLTDSFINESANVQLEKTQFPILDVEQCSWSNIPY